MQTRLLDSLGRLRQETRAGEIGGRPFGSPRSPRVPSAISSLAHKTKWKLTVNKPVYRDSNNTTRKIKIMLLAVIMMIMIMRMINNDDKTMIMMIKNIMIMLI